uniref:Putative ABC transporter ATP-binding protein n=1 Tax=uncultured bacterium fosmid pJB77G10 TaxID=1478069 RepID=A0A0H3U828_9BACT|nr:putative ABC transporter ATP-binding protein [uncultured bacterium fosmid pJB77G10]
MQRAADNLSQALVRESFSFEEVEDDIILILRYYKLPFVKVPKEVTDENDKLAYVCRSSGLMRRTVKLEKGWHKCAFGAFLCKFKDSDTYVAVVPNTFGNYSYYDKKNKKRVRINSKNAELLDDTAICFYKPLPNSEISVMQLVQFGLSAWSVSDILYTVALMLFSTAVGLLLPVLNEFLFSNVVTTGSVSLLLSTVLYIVCVNITMLLINVMKSMFSQRNGVKMDAALRSATMMRTLSLSPEFFSQYSSGEIITRMDYMNAISMRIVSTIFGTILPSIFSLAYITQISAYTSVLVLPSLVVIFAQVLFSVYTTFRQMAISKRIMEIDAENSGIGIEMISSVQKIKLTGSEKRMFARYADEYAKSSRLSYNPPFFNKYNGVISLAITLAGQLLIYSTVIGTSITAAQYYAFQASFGMISGAITSLVGVAIEVANLKPSIEMVQPMIHAVPENADKSKEVLTLDGRIEMNNVSFRYNENGKNIINDLSIKIEPGQYLAIVGKTGCGKSTLIKLLLGFVTPQAGSIMFDNFDLTSLDKRSLRRKIGTVMQNDQLFTADIYSNIVICEPSLPMDRAWEAAEIAGIADDIRSMPMGMHTVISEGGGGISGGQRQRIAIARAVAPRPKILIFDEATSALDNITQKKISQALDKLDCTRIVIAHRLSTIKNCDRIIVLDEGHIVEDGTYDELLAKQGFFADLIERQRLDA